MYGNVIRVFKQNALALATRAIEGGNGWEALLAANDLHRDIRDRNVFDRAFGQTVKINANARHAARGDAADADVGKARRQLCDRGC